MRAPSSDDGLVSLCEALETARPELPERRTPEAITWARSGAMALTGRADGPPLLGTGAPATAVRRALDVLAAAAPHADLPGVGLLGERAAIAGLHRQAPWSPGGAFRVLPAGDGWLGLSLPRESDRELVPALVQRETADPWDAVTDWLAGTAAAAAEERAVLLGLPAAAVPDAAPRPSRPPVVATPGGPRRPSREPLVVDLSALWAGPLCAHLLGRTGARVIKVESGTRLDGARRGPRAFYDLMHAGHESVVLDLAADRLLLLRLLRAADVVIEASRPRALAQLGIDAAEFVAGGTVWISLTAYGRDEPNALRVGFGDDVAAGAGLVVFDAGRPLPMADALADPLAGVTAAAAAVLALSGGRGALLDVSMHDVAVAAAQPAVGPAARVTPAAAGWLVTSGDERVQVAAPRARRPSGVAAEAGEHTAAVRTEFAG